MLVYLCLSVLITVISPKDSHSRDHALKLFSLSFMPLLSPNLTECHWSERI